MNILFVRFPLESAFGGAEIQTSSLMRELTQRGHSVSFLGSCKILLSLCEQYDIPATYLEIGPPPVTKTGSISFAWRRRRMSRLLQEALRQHDSLDAIVLLGLSEKLLLTPLVADSTRVIWLEHDPVGRWLTHNPWLPELRKKSRGITTVCVSELSRRLYLNLGWEPDSVTAIPNGIDLSRFEKTDVAQEGTLHIGCIARLAKEKGVDVLIRAAIGLPDVRLSIIGKGPEDINIRSLIANSNIADTTDIREDCDDLGAWYSSIDLFVLPSVSNDPFGLTAAEAMSMGVATIVTDACGIADYVNHKKDAWICKADDVQSLKKAIETLKNDAALRSRLAQEGQKTAQKSFGIASMADKYEQLLRGESL